MPIKLSIVVPVYNKENTIKRTIDTIIPQLNDESEVVFVDDGSSDSSLNILNKLKEDNKDKNIKVIHKENDGLISAREAGIRASSGEFISNVDGGDGLIDGSINDITNQIKENPNIDYYVMDCKTIDSNGEHYLRYNEKYISDIKYLLLGQCPYSICFKVFRRSLMLDIDLTNKCKGISTGEDLCFSYNLMSKTNKAKKLDKCTYIYNIDEVSMTSDEKESIVFLKALKYVRDEINHNNIKLKPEMDYLIFKCTIMSIILKGNRDNMKSLYEFYKESNINKGNRYIKYQTLCTLLAKIKVRIYG